MRTGITWVVESFRLVRSYLTNNSLRSLLSVVGVSIGIFCIVAVLTFTYSLERNIRSSIDELGDNIVYIQKTPWVFDGSYKWWEYQRRPEILIKDYRRFSRMADREVIPKRSFFFQFGQNTLKSNFEELKGVQMAGVEGDFFPITKWPIGTGRAFTRLEEDKGRNVCILGADVATSLFGTFDPMENRLRVNGRNVQVVGVLEKRGNSMGGQNYDELIVTPAAFALQFNAPGKGGVFSAMVLKGDEAQTMDAVEMEINRVMRPMRRLRPKDKNNFAINKLTLFSDALNQTFAVINLVGWLIGGFSLLVGGFGIANIMFVSVKERTSLIGLQKALGAKKRFIRLQFLMESVLLCLVGASLGILGVYLLGLVVSSLAEFPIHFSTGVLLQGTLVAVVIGLSAGLIPAITASRLDPVIALRSQA